MLRGRQRTDAVAAALERVVPGAVARHVGGRDYTTYRVGGPIDVMVTIRDDTALARVTAVLADHEVPVLVVGRGSNLLVADAGFPGVAILLRGAFDALRVDAARGTVWAGGGLALPVLARRTAAAGWGGLEFYVGIPGSVGGAVRMNAGGHGRDTREVLRQATVIDVTSPQPVARPWAATELDFGYRHSAIGPRDLVIGAEFALSPEPVEVCQARIDEIVRWRREHQPGGANSGSVFKNPDGDAAGRLIDAAGCKGLRVGGAVVSPKHANFFCAEAGASAGDVARLISVVRERVHATSGVWLEPELQMVGFELDGGGL